MATGYVPKCWYDENTMVTQPYNFRPISIYDKILHDQVSTFIKENAFLNDG